MFFAKTNSTALLALLVLCLVCVLLQAQAPDSVVVTRAHPVDSEASPATLHKLPPVDGDRLPRADIERLPLPINPAQPAADPALPPTVKRFQAAETWELSLEEAIYIALEQNKTIAVLLTTPEESATQIATADSEFDPIFEMGGMWSRTDRQNASTVDSGANFQQQQLFGSSAGQTDQLGLSKKFVTGGSLRASYSTGFTNSENVGPFTALNPTWSTSAGLTFEQPLMRGRGFVVNEIPIRVARLNYDQSTYEFESSINALIRELELAYLNFHLSAEQLAVRQRALDRARITWEKEIEKKKLGESARPEVAQARQQYESTRMDFVLSQQQLLSAERQLRSLLGLPGFDGRRIVTATDQSLPRTLPDWSFAVDEALLFRPELNAQRQAVEAARLDVVLGTNNKLPDFNFVAGYTTTGLDDDFGESVERLVSGNTTDWTMGFTYQRPIWNEAALSEEQRARIRLSRQHALLDQMEHAVLHELQDAYQQLAVKLEHVKLSRNVREAAHERLVAYQEFRELGDLSIDLLIRAQASYAAAELVERQAMIEYVRARAVWEYAKGTILTNRNVVIADEELDGNQTPQ